MIARSGLFSRPWARAVAVLAVLALEPSAAVTIYPAASHRDALLGQAGKDLVSIDSRLIQQPPSGRSEAHHALQAASRKAKGAGDLAPEPGTWSSAGLAWGPLSAGVLLACALAELAALATLSQPTEGFVETAPWLLKVQKGVDAVLMAAMISVDSVVESITVPLLPLLSRGDGVQALYFVKPFLALTTAVLLPLLLQSGVHRGRFVAAAGLVFLSFSCFALAVEASFMILLLARVATAVSSAAIMVSVFHTIMLQAPPDRVGWRLNIAMSGLTIGLACGPWIGSFLMRSLGMQAMFGVLSAAAAGICCMHLATTMWIVKMPSGCQRCHPLERGLSGSVLQAASLLLGDAKQRLLLAGVGVSAAVLSLHCTLVPAYLGTSEAAESAALLSACSNAGLTMALPLLACGLAVDAAAEGWAIRSMVVAHVAGVLGLRALMDGQSSGQPLTCLFGLFASQAGTGAFVGLAMPIVLRLSRGCSTIPTLSTSAVASTALGTAWLLGDALGVGLQVLLHHAIGFKYTILGFTAAVAVHAMALVAQPWSQRKLPDLLASSQRELND